ncbi:MAG TPA: tryptophan 2,3-dioxygenase [Deltaproteobacteria bacterium]|nr:tryptophan 2,3-dioxygenase [Deltaproteobacteria bacterium]
MSNIPTYWDYLRLDRLLDLQGGLEGDDSQLLADELHFIVVHQSFELWFKLLLRELRLARDHLGQPKVDEETIPHVVQHLRRINAVLRHAVNQFEVMETLTPQGFLDFRDKLVPSSGFQSFQMREVEILMGLEDADRIQYGNIDPIRHLHEVAHDTPAGRLATSRIAAVRAERTVLSVLNEWLYRTPIQGSTPGDPGDDRAVEDFLGSYLARMSDHHAANLTRLLDTLEVSDPEGMRTKFASIQEDAKTFLHASDTPEPARPRTRRIRAAALFIESYRQLPLLSWPRLLLDLVVEMEEQLVLWRHRHVRMVERTIGRRVGTGGSGGVDYLEQTGSYRVFRDLWVIRTLLLPTSRLPELTDPTFYAFNST